MKTNERPTPITDAIYGNPSEQRPSSEYIGKATMRDLERQLAESREENARLNKSLSNASAIYDAVCEQRARLAAFVESLVDANGPHPDINGSSAIPAAYSILAAVKGGKQ